MLRTTRSNRALVPGFAPEGKVVWDCWFAKRGREYHVFYLQAKRSRDPDARHNRASIGHAVSTDLRRWRRADTALQAGSRGAWDDLALWTGSVFRSGTRSLLFYTGRSRERECCWVQKIGMASSADLRSWERLPDPVLQSDARWYQMHNEKNRLGKIAAWRDPFVFRDPKTGRYCMLLAARAAGRRREYNGCIALAQSRDLAKWTVRPPVLAPGRYDEMECPQLFFHQGHYYLLFSTWASGYEPAWAKRAAPTTGLHCYWSRRLEGPYQPLGGSGILVDYGDSRYGYAIVEKRGGTVTLMGWQNLDARGRFIGRLAEPVKIRVGADPDSLRCLPCRTARPPQPVSPAR